MKCFITGTDTGVGKTYVSVKLIKYLNQFGLRTIGVKPLATGCSLKHGKLYNDDALLLQKSSSIKVNYSLANPIVFEQAIAPSIAAAKNNVSLTAKGLVNAILPIFSVKADCYVVEGVGGWYVPLNEKETMADFVVLANLPVMMVVGIRLGCLSHALLTEEAIRASGVPFVGWVANCFEMEEAQADEMVAHLTRNLKSPPLWVEPFSQFNA